MRSVACASHLEFDRNTHSEGEHAREEGGVGVEGDCSDGERRRMTVLQESAP